MGKLRPRRGGSRAKATQEGRAGAEFTPGGKEEAGTGRMTQRARSRALGLGGRAAGRPLPHRSCHGRTRGSPEPAFLNPVWKTRFISGRPAACQAFTSPVLASGAGSLGRTFCVSQGQGPVGPSPGPGHFSESHSWWRLEISNGQTRGTPGLS